MKCPKCGYNSFEFLDSCKKCNNDLSSFKQNHGLKAIIIPFPAKTIVPPAKTETAPATATIAAASVAAVASSAVAADDTFTWDDSPAPAAAKQEEDIFPDLTLNTATPSPSSDEFSFDLDAPEPQADIAAPADDFSDFSFDEPPTEPIQAVTASEPAAAFDDSFEGLLETSEDQAVAAAPALGAAEQGFEMENPWDVPEDSLPVNIEVASATEASTAAGGDFELDSFSWEEPTEPVTPPQAPKRTQPEPDPFASDELSSLFGDDDQSSKS